MPAPRQTVSYLLGRFREVGLRPDPRHGQNFLVDLNLLELLARTADAGSSDVMLEVGTGTGSLTAMLAANAAAVVSVEIDEHLHQLASEALIDCENVTLLHQDALRNKNNLHPNVLAAVQEKLAEAPQRRLKLAANLPYSIATPIISNLLSTEVTPFSMTVTIQKELADRICARPSTKDYSALSVWVQSLCDAEIIRIMPPTVFWPQPKVHSAILQILPREDKRRLIPDLEFFHSFVRAMFFHRRKFLRSVILAGYKQLEKPVVDEIMAAQSLAPDARAEQLDVAQMLTLCEAVRARIA